MLCVEHQEHIGKDRKKPRKRGVRWRCIERRYTLLIKFSFKRKVNTLVESRGMLHLFVSSLLIKLSRCGCRLSLGWTILNPHVIILLFCLSIASLVYNSFSFANIIILSYFVMSISRTIIGIKAYQFRITIGIRAKGWR